MVRSTCATFLAWPKCHRANSFRHSRSETPRPISALRATLGCLSHIVTFFAKALEHFTRKVAKKTIFYDKQGKVGLYCYPPPQ